MHHHLSVLGLAFAMLFLASPSLTIAATSYEVLDFGVIDGGDDSIAIAINNQNYVVGASQRPTGGLQNAMFYDPASGPAGPRYDLGLPEEALSYLNDISDVVGDVFRVVGRTQASGGSVPMRRDITVVGPTFNFDPMVPLEGDGSPSGSGGEATGVNRFKTVVGTYHYDLASLAVTWDANATSPSSQFPTSSHANKINDRGDIAGVVGGEAAAWVGGIGGTLVNFAPGLSGVATDVNTPVLPTDNPIVVGTINNSIFMATLDATGPIQLTYLPSPGPNPFAYAINRDNDIVGSFNTGNGDHGFIYDHSTQQSVDLNGLIDPMSGWILGAAVDINDNGWIVGAGQFFDGSEFQTRGYILKPISGPPTVPEPGSMACVMLGVVACGVRRNQR